MNFVKLDKYLRSKKLVDRRIIKQWSWIRYTTADQLYAVVSITKKGRPVLSLNCRSKNVQLYRDTYPDIVVPALELDKNKWSSIYLDKELPQDFIKTMIDESYKLAYDCNINMRIFSGGNALFDYTKVKNHLNFNLLLCDNSDDLADFLKGIEDEIITSPLDTKVTTTTNKQ